ncbi:glucarate dehydratase [Clostridium sp. chh4-2]|uniref:enolase C-terminal domain-like protein n=1 Tax=Clostridium sp. chh4-2 TaxID=2067550 RepID=UPI000CCEA5A6|nr:enolase C-terminal domain-like protein [Clostridium sp. chh4-2]PNV60198.1 glucarate dehydratase [Clostridium sp. chh4-2]
MEKGTPVVVDMQVIPVAGHDSMLMTLSGAHGPFFTRNLVILKDSAGHTGIGEIHGGDYTCDALTSCIPLVVGKQIGTYRKILDSIHKASSRSAEDDGEGIQSLDISKLKFVVKAEWAIECALLDLLGQYLDLPVCELLGDGKQRDKVETLGYLFYVSDKKKADLPYLDECYSVDPWFKLRREEMLTPERIVEQACTLNDKYGFKNFKLKGGVLAGAEEMEAIKALKKQFPEGRINIDPNGAWSLEEAVRICKPMEGVLTYIEDPCGPEAGFSSREIMAEFKNAVNLPVATNMIATDWRQFYHAAALKSVDIVLADPHFWGFGGSVRMAQILNDWGLTWGSHSNNHFDITLTAFAHVAAAAPGNPTALDTHWIWQDGQNLLDDTPQIKDGYLEVPTKPGLGVTINMDKVMEANKLYNQLPYHDRNDAEAMQYLIPNWKFDSKKPCLVR